MSRSLLWVGLFWGFLSVSASANYQIQPGDHLQILVMGHPDYSLMVTVRPEGSITYFGGDLPAAGRSLDQLAEDIRERLKPYLAQPTVAVIPTLQEEQFFILGEVVNAGAYPLPVGRALTLPQALAMAGGLRPDTADPTQVAVYRSTARHPEIYDLRSAEAMNVSVQTGDVVWVHKRLQIRVSGIVQNPGVFFVSRPVTLPEALALAGGPLHDVADTSHLRVYRADGSLVQIAPEEPLETVTLGDGDTLFVPHAYQERKIFVLGFVRNPGAYEVKGPVPVLEAIALAGGALEAQANLKEAWIIRTDGQNQPVNLERLYREKASDSPLIFPGDALHIPRKRQINWSLILSFLSIISVTINLIRR